MNPLLNLLPWRQRRRLRQLHLWIMIAAGCSAMGIIIAIALPKLTSWQQDVQRLQHNYLVQMNSALQNKYQEVRELKIIQQQREKANARRQAFADWEARLTHLARQLPAGVWLTSLSLKHGEMLIKGQATQTADIKLVEAGLHKLEGTSVIKTGTIYQNAKGLMVFAFTVTFSEVIHVLSG